MSCGGEWSWLGSRGREQIRDQLGSRLGRRLEQLPRLVLRILRVEVRKEGRISEVLQAGSVVGHDIGLSWEVLGHMAVAVLPLVLSREDALLGWRTVGRNRLLTHLGLSRGVVHEGDCCRALDGVALCHGADLGEHAGVLEVTVCDGASWVVGRDQAGLDISWEGGSPHERVPPGVAVDATHSGFGSVRGPKVAS